jgi:DNA mismatch repair protein MSH5
MNTGCPDRVPSPHWEFRACRIGQDRYDGAHLHQASYTPSLTLSCLKLETHVRIQTRESVSVGLSAFMIDLNQISAALNGATTRSLVVLDEFGKGTGTRDGMSLLVACLEHWLKMNEDCPNILVSTHFHGIVKQKLLPKSPLLEYLTMETIQDGDELIFLYQLVPGHCDSSHACYIAAMAGVPKAVVERGRQVSELFRKNLPIPRLNTPSMEEKIRVSEKIVSKFFELDFEKDDLEAFLRDFVKPAAKGIL